MDTTNNNNMNLTLTVSELVIDNAADIVGLANGISPLTLTVSCIGSTGLITLFVIIRHLFVAKRSNTTVRSVVSNDRSLETVV